MRERESERESESAAAYDSKTPSATPLIKIRLRLTLIPDRAAIHSRSQPLMSIGRPNFAFPNSNLPSLINSDSRHSIDSIILKIRYSKSHKTTNNYTKFQNGPAIFLSQNSKGHHSTHPTYSNLSKRRFSS